jgi:hypothetical protein
MARTSYQESHQTYRFFLFIWNTSMFRHIVIATAIALFVVLSCRKKDPPPADDPTTTGTTTATTSGSTTPTPTIPVAVVNTTATTYSGFFTTGTYSIMPGNVFYSSAAAAFCDPPAASAPLPGIYAGRVKLNNDSLTYSSSGYNSSSVNLNLSSERWALHGGAKIPAFNFTNTLPGPTAQNIMNLPTSISKAAGVTINLGELTSVRSGTFVLSDGMNGNIIRTFTGNSYSLEVTPGLLANFNNGSGSNIYLTLENWLAASAMGKDFRFVKQSVLMLSVTVNP